MSFSSTTTLERRKTALSTVYLSPTKRSRPTSPPPRIGSSTQEIYNWTFHSDAIAACFIKDAHELKISTDRKYSDFFWLGSVPCRVIKVVGVVVGVQVYERRILYSVDDGTGVIDCYHAQSKEKPTSKFQKHTEAQSPSLKPVAQVGSTVEVTGSVREVHDFRQITVTDIKLCISPNEELLHARTVRTLHQTKYTSKEHFVVPQYPSTPRKPIIPTTPSTLRSSPPSSVSSSPIKPEHIEQNFKSPIKLRHPSRLHTHDLTENTFRIYLKHYMDHASGSSHEEYDSDFGAPSSVFQIPSTPTKHSRIDKTPRQSTTRHEFDATPRPRIRPPDFGIQTNQAASSSSTRPSAAGNARKGFTLSFLRRVPELSLLATKVVQAVGRRRMREEKQKLKDAGTIPSRSEKSRILSLSVIPSDKFAGKTKRLFQWAIIQLLKEGSIVHWDGPVRPCPETAMMDTSRLWKTNTSSILVDDSNLFSTTAGSALADSSVGDGTLSDPDANEEAYITLTSDYLADFVEKAIGVLVEHYEKNGKPYAGATKEGILAVLRKDDRWKYVGEWHIEDALDLLRRDGKVWSTAKGRWDLTG